MVFVGCRTLELDNCGLNGTIPSWITGLGDLASLHLEFNQLTGPLPDGIAAMVFVNSLT